VFVRDRQPRACSCLVFAVLKLSIEIGLVKSRRLRRLENEIRMV
jgi:hypothetical protein